MVNESSSKSQIYDDSSIEQLDGAARIRMRPASMLGSSGLSGARHGFTEIYGNALDEASSGFGDRLEVTYHADKSLSVRDYGRGVPLGWNENRGTYNWHIIYNDLYGGGKYNNNQAELAQIEDWGRFDETAFNYLYSVGLNGLGAASTQYTSEFFTVESYRDGKCTRMRFERGLPLIDGQPVNVFTSNYDMQSFVPDITDTDQPNGTLVHWKPDDTVFTDTDVGGDWLYEVCKDIAYVAHIDLHFRDETRGIDEVIHAGDLQSLLQAKYGEKLRKTEDDDGELQDTEVYTLSVFNHGDTIVEGKPYIWVCKVQAAIGYAGEHGNLSHCCYHNSVYMRGGVQYDGIVSAIRKFFTEVGKRRGVKFEAEDYRGIFVVALSSYSNYASFRNQTKDEVSNTFIYDIVEKAVLDRLMLEYSKETPEILDAIDRAVREAEIRIATKEATKQARELNKAMRNNKLPDKFATCRAFSSKDFANAELWIVEGDSAAGAVKQARDSKYQAVFPVRGKCLNVLKSSLAKIIACEVIIDIFTLLGTGMRIEGNDRFDITQLRFGKVIICTDADEDGFQIRVLLFLIFYLLAPEMLREGMVYIAETPRFEIRLKNGESIYAKDDKERDRIWAKYAGKIQATTRFKGLGEVNPGVLRTTTLHPDTRNLVPLTIDFDDPSTISFIDALFGADKMKQRQSILMTALGSDVVGMMNENMILMEQIDNADIEEETEVITVGA